MTVNKSILFSGVAIAMLLLACGIFFTMGGIINTDSSIPPGLYWKIDKPLAIGRTVVLCPPNQPVFQEARKQGLIATGSCPDNFGTLLLKVAGKRKDIVTINENGVFINDVLLPQSKPLSQDNQRQALPPPTVNRYELKENEVVLMSDDSQTPFDSRYFGQMNTDQIDSVISPIFD